MPQSPEHPQAPDRRRQSAVVSGPFLAALVVTAVLGLVIYVTPPYLGGLGPEEMRFWVMTRVAWLAAVLALATYTAVRFLRRP